ncbi:MAG TPA: PGPGW domain-containing protein [Candidatus Binatia bacterium]|nr:PGPGW domain-containing protein [Candidatus Binatia bacterium]
MLRHTIRASRIVVGLALVLVGLVLCFIPGPGLPIVFVGLTVLSTEFHWARRLRDWMHATFRRATERIHGR